SPQAEVQVTISISIHAESQNYHDYSWHPRPLKAGHGARMLLKRLAQHLRQWNPHKGHPPKPHLPNHTEQRQLLPRRRPISRKSLIWTRARRRQSAIAPTDAQEEMPLIWPVLTEAERAGLPDPAHEPAPGPQFLVGAQAMVLLCAGAIFKLARQA